MKPINPKIKAKIRKCLALANSANATEAETALRQAKKLMEQAGLSEVDLIEVSSHSIESRATKSPPMWESNLANTVAQAFACRMVFWSAPGLSAKWQFLGLGPSAELAAYCFDVLQRQCVSDRRRFIKNELSRVRKAGVKRARADTFCEGWVASAGRKIREVFGSHDVPEPVNQWIEKNVPALSRRDPRASKASLAKTDDLLGGAARGSRAQLMKAAAGPGDGQGRLMKNS
jgi:hypothetical protein